MSTPESILSFAIGQLDTAAGRDDSELCKVWCKSVASKLPEGCDGWLDDVRSTTGQERCRAVQRLRERCYSEVAGMVPAKPRHVALAAR